MNIGQRKGRSIKRLCSLLGYSRQAFYQGRRAKERQVLEEELLIQEVWRIRHSQKRVGTRKLLLMLQPLLYQQGISIGRDALFALLGAHGLLIRKRRRRVPRTTFSDHGYKKYPNLIIGMPVVKPNQLWVSDITYIKQGKGFAYLSLVTDAYSRMIVGYYLNQDLQASGCVKALQMAIKQLPGDAELIHHSDRGSQYCSTKYVEQLDARNISISMTQHSDPLENAIAERVNGIIKQELLEEKYPSLKAADEGIKSAITLYNYERLHSSIDMLTPYQAHHRKGKLKRHWKNYYQPKNQEALMM